VKQAPAWNKVVEDFASADVVFGDVTLSSDQVRSIHETDQNPGAGGWPTIRYFNKETGYGGKTYEKKTDKAMCDELGPKEEYMQEFVEEISGASLCDINASGGSTTGCSEQQSKFIEKSAGKDSADLKKQLARLQGMAEKDGSSMKPEALKWIKQRVNIFKQLLKKAGSDEL